MTIVPWVPISGSFGSLPALTGVTSGTAAPEDTITTPDGYDPADPDDIWDEFPEDQAATADSGYLPIVVIPPYSLAEPLAAVTLSGGTVEVLGYSLAPVATPIEGVTLSGGTVTPQVVVELPAAVVAVGTVAPEVVVEVPEVAPTLLLHFDGSNNSTTITDSSANAWPISVFGDAKLTTTGPKFGSAWLTLDGNGDFIRTPADPAFRIGTNDFTIDFWCFPEAISGAHGIYAFGTPADDDFLAGPGFSINLGYWSPNQSSSSSGLVEPVAQPAELQHIAVTRAGTTVRFFIDGVLTATRTWSNNWTTDRLVIGSYFVEGSASYSFTGKIDEFRFINGVAVWTANFTPPTAAYPDPDMPAVVEVPAAAVAVAGVAPEVIGGTGSAVVDVPAVGVTVAGVAPEVIAEAASTADLLLHFDGANDSTTFTDSGKDGLTIAVFSGAKISTTESKFGGASGRFTSGAYIATPSSPTWDFSGQEPFTVECFYRPDNITDGSRGIFSTRIGGVFCPFEVQHAQARLRLLVQDGTSSSWYETGFTADFMTAGEWAHIALSGDGTNLRLFQNGTLALTSSHRSWSAGHRLYVGGGGDGTVNGYIDELRLIMGTAVYTSGFTPPTAPFD